MTSETSCEAAASTCSDDPLAEARRIGRTRLVWASDEDRLKRMAEARARVRARREEQGLPPTIPEPELIRLAAIAFPRGLEDRSTSGDS